jgi:polar amino acid transport system substrate-binding protein
MKAGRMVLLLCLAWLTGRPAAAEAPPLILVSDAQSLNFQMHDGAADGFFAAVLREALGQGAGRHIEFRVRPLARCFEEARTGEVDGLFAIYHVGERERFFLYSAVPLHTEQEHIFVGRGRTLDVRHWREALAGKRIAVVNGSYHGSAYQQALADHLFGAVELVNSIESLVPMLESGRVDAVFSTHDLMGGALARLGRGRNAIAELEPAIEAMPVYLAFTRLRDMSAVRDQFDHELTRMKEDGRYEALRKRYAVN